MLVGHVYIGVIFIAILIERWCYQTKPKVVQPDEVATDERFVDPETGERRYAPVLKS